MFTRRPCSSTLRRPGFFPFGNRQVKRNRLGPPRAKILRKVEAVALRITKDKCGEKPREALCHRVAVGACRVFHVGFVLLHHDARIALEQQRVFVQNSPKVLASHKQNFRRAQCEVENVDDVALEGVDVAHHAAVRNQREDPLFFGFVEELVGAEPRQRIQPTSPESLPL